MKSWFAASFLLVGVVSLVRLFGLLEKSRRVFPIVLHSLGTIQNPCLDDEAKETALKKNAIGMFNLFFQLVFCGAFAISLPLAFVWLATKMDLISFGAVERTTVSPDFLLGSFSFAIVFFWVTSPSRGASRSKYSALDRISHQFAFNTALTQIAMARLEDRLLAKKLVPVRTDNPVFITAMPRAGTTLLLECLAKHPEFASHIYRDMPFLLIPWCWSRFSALFRKSNGSQERAHGDGMLINFDSPEAFEELIWKTFWYGKYQDERIPPWEEERDEEFEKFYRNHIRKIIYLREGKEAGSARYVSKNNLNMCRIPLLHDIFPSSTILVPFRDPIQHCASLLRQHKNFSRIHKEDPFASEYMEAIGHFDFGENLRPIDFNGWYHKRKTQDPFALAFWLEYWNACYEWILKTCSDLVYFVNYEALCAKPTESFLALSETLGVKDRETFLAIGKDVRSIRLQDVDTGEVPDELLQKSLELYARLQEHSLNSSH